MATITDGTAKWNLQKQTDINLDNTKFTASQQGERTVTVTNVAGTIDDNTNTGSGNISSTTYTFVTKSGITAGTYTFSDIIQRLINLSHSHRTTKGVSSWDCNCNCKCNCSDDH